VHEPSGALQRERERRERRRTESGADNVATRRVRASAQIIDRVADVALVMHVTRRILRHVGTPRLSGQFTLNDVSTPRL
jgi:hypothetical protein